MIDKVALQCRSCTFRFKRAQVPKLCPNCGGQTVEKDDMKGASDILKEIDNIESRRGVL